MVRCRRGGRRAHREGIRRKQRRRLVLIFCGQMGETPSIEDAQPQTKRSDGSGPRPLGPALARHAALWNDPNVWQ